MDVLKQLPPGVDVSQLDYRVRRLFEIPQPAQRSEEWLKMRVTVLTASDAAAALNIPPYESYKGSPRAELLKKKAQQIIGITTFTGNVFTEWGQKYEDVARDIYIERYNDPVLEFGLLPHPEYPFLAGSPDGVSLHPRAVEIKWCASAFVLHYCPSSTSCSIG